MATLPASAPSRGGWPAGDDNGQKSATLGRGWAEVGAEWPAFADDPPMPGLGFWLVLLAGGLMSAIGFGLLILWWLA